MSVVHTPVRLADGDFLSLNEKTRRCCDGMKARGLTRSGTPLQQAIQLLVNTLYLDNGRNPGTGYSVRSFHPAASRAIPRCRAGKDAPLPLLSELSSQHVLFLFHSFSMFD